MIPYGRHNISEADIEAVVEVLRSDFITQGPVVPQFENAIASYCGGKYAIASNSATSALHLACRALQLGPGDTLWTSPITFVASANCALYCGAEVDFVDIDPKTFNLSVDALKTKLEQAEKSGKLPKIIIPVHLCGLSCDMESMGALAQRYGFSIIEDASHAIGGQYRGQPIGNCQYSDITVFSFHPVKIITTGEGGVSVTNNEALAEKMALLRTHGITRDPALMTHEPDGVWYYQQVELGYNYRMTDIHAALGLSQLSRLGAYVKRRHEIARRYDDKLKLMPVRQQYQPADCYSAMHLYVIRVETNKVNRTHKQIFTELRESGVGVNLHYAPVPNQPWYRALGFEEGDFPEAEKYYSEAISFPIFPDLKDHQFDAVIKSLRTCLK